MNGGIDFKPLGREELEPMAEQIAQQKGIPVHIFKGMIDHESSWNPYAKNPKSSATGLGQHLDRTLRNMGHEPTGGPDDPRYNPQLSLELAADHLLEKYKDTGDWRRAVMNYGEGTEAYIRKVEKSVAKYYKQPQPGMVSQMAGAVGNFLGPSQAQAADGPADGYTYEPLQPGEMDFEPATPEETQPQAAPVPTAETPSAVAPEQPKPVRPLIEESEPSISGLLKKTMLGMGGGGLEQMKENLTRYLGPQGVGEFSKDFYEAMQKPEAIAFGALDPMIGAVTPVSKGALAGKAAVTAKDKELSALERVVGMEKFDPTEMQRLRTLAKSFGIDLTVPELTNSPTLRGLWTRLAKTPGPQAEKLATYLEEVRKPQVEAAIQRELGNIAPESRTAFEAGGQARGTAREIEEGLRQTRATETRPMYKEAFEQQQPVDVASTLETLAKEAEKYPEGHPSLATLQQTSKMLTKEQVNPTTKAVEVIQETDLQVLHNAKVGIDQLLERAKRDKSIDNDTRRLLMRVKTKLQGEMEASNPLYAEAQRRYRELSKPLKDFRFGSPDIKPRDPHVKTMIAQLADLGDEAFERAPGIVFGGNTPAKIERTRAYFEKNHPEVWDPLVRSWLEQKLNRLRDTVIQRESNVGGAFKRAVFNDNMERSKLRAALGPEKFGRLESFMEVLDKTRRIIYTNSETAFQIEAGRILEQGGVSEILSQIPMSKGGALKWLVSRFDKLHQPVFAARLADAMLDPAHAIELTKIKRMADGPKKAFATAQMLDSAVFKGPRPTAPDPEAYKFLGGKRRGPED